MGMMSFLLSGFIIIAILFVLLILSDSDGKTNIRKYEVRFAAHNNKYYIVNCIKNKEEKVTGTFGFTIYYDDLVKADFACEQLNKDYSIPESDDETILK